MGSLPDGVKIISDQNPLCDLTIWFCKSQIGLDRDISGIVTQSNSGPVWIAWPKKQSSSASDLTQQSVRLIGMANNLVDYKISSFDDTWSGLLFRYREQK
jgi:hypothetical protein